MPIAASNAAARRWMQAIVSPSTAALSRTVVVVAHVDDETIGLGSRLPYLGDATFVYVTDSAPLDRVDAVANGFAHRIGYRDARRAELGAAFALCGISIDRIESLGVSDQRAAFNLAGLARTFADQLVRDEPEVIVAHPYEGGHPDHDAAAFIVHAGVALAERRVDLRPAIVEMTSYHNGPAGLTPSTFLPDDRCDVTTIQLTPEERTFKRSLFDCFVTQQSTLQYFPIELERFRSAPAYDFTRPPHDGTLFYENYDWGLNGIRFRALAARAMAELGLEASL